MEHTIELAALGAVAFIVLDRAWLGVLMKDFHREQLAPVVRLPGTSTVPSAAGYSARFGLVVYGVYDFTSYSTLRQWLLVLTLADVAWGAAASAVAAAAVRSVVR